MDSKYAIDKCALFWAINSINWTKTFGFLAFEMIQVSWCDWWLALQIVWRIEFNSGKMSEETEIVLQKDVYVSHCDNIVITIKSGSYAWECGEKLKSIIEYECKEYVKQAKNTHAHTQEDCTHLTLQWV